MFSLRTRQKDVVTAQLLQFRFEAQYEKKRKCIRRYIGNSNIFVLLNSTTIRVMVEIISDFILKYYLVQFDVWKSDSLTIMYYNSLLHPEKKIWQTKFFHRAHRSRQMKKAKFMQTTVTDLKLFTLPVQKRFKIYCFVLTWR